MRTLLFTAAIVWSLVVVFLVFQGEVADPRGSLVLILPALAVFVILTLVPKRHPSADRGESRRYEDSPPMAPGEEGASPGATRKRSVVGRIAGCAGALLVSVIAGIVVYWLTLEGGWIVPPPPPPQPAVRILSVDVAPIVAGRMSIATAKVTVHNEGQLTAEDCRVDWYSHGMSSAASSSVTFGLPAGATQVFHISSTIFQVPNTYPSQTIVLCRNAASASVPRDVIVQ